MASRQDHQVQESPQIIMNHQDAQDEHQASERVGLLGYTRLADRRPTSTELRLGILAFWSLCFASIGFGLFAGEVEKFERFKTHHGRPVKVVTSTIYLSPTNAPTPPGNICSSAPCVDVAGDLLRTILWSVEPCENFSKFSTAQLRPPAIEVISARIDQTIKQIMASPSANPTIQKIQEFHSLCSRTASSTSYSEFSSILRMISDLLMIKTHSPADRFGALLAYLHSASLPAFFKTSISNHQLTLKPAIISLQGIEDAFTSIYPADEIFQRIEGVKKLTRRLSSLKDGSQETKLVTLNELQDLSCTQPWVPCWIRWKDYYSALNSERIVGQVTVQGTEYFVHLGRVILEQEDMVLESYFHWVTLATLGRKNCKEELQLHFGPSLLKNIFLTSQDELTDWKNKIQAAQLVFQSLVDLEYKPEWPRVIETPWIEKNQEEELSSVRKNNWADTVYELARIKTRKEFVEGQTYWNGLGAEINIIGDRLYLPMGALQTPMLYPSIGGLPKSLLFGSFGFSLVEAFQKIHDNSSFHFQDNSCQVSVSKSFEIWKKYKTKNRNQKNKQLVGLLNKVKTADQLFYLAFGRLGIVCPGLEQTEGFINTFNCSQSAPNPLLVNVEL